MIRAFEQMDARRIKANEFSDPADMAFVFNDDGFCKHTLVSDESDVLAIICWRSYWKNNYLAFLLISEDMTAIRARALKKFIFEVIMDFGMQRVQTDSVDCPELNRWHDFLGFTLEGKRPKMLYDKDYNSWGMVKGRDF